MAFDKPQVSHLFPRAVCTKCGENKPISDFNADRAKPRGRDTQCKECTKERDAKNHDRNLAHRQQAISEGHRKNCRVCGELKFIAEYPAAPSNRGGSSHECTSCFSIRHLKWRTENADHVRSRGRATMRKLRSKEDKERQAARVRKSRLKIQYGMTHDDLAAMRLSQNNQCGICFVEFGDTAWGATAVAIDHDHKTKKVRGLLCTKCNRGLGLFCDDEETMRKAIAYLERTRK